MSLDVRKNLGEYLVAGTAFLISACTLGVYLYQSRVMTQQQHVTVWPYVEWTVSNVVDFHISAQNKGVGPAIIRQVEMSVGGKPVKDNGDMVDAVVGPKPSFEWENSTLEGRVLSPGEEVKLFIVHDHKAGVQFENALDARSYAPGKKGLHIRITYCSIYGDCWISEGVASRRTASVDLGLF